MLLVFCLLVKSIFAQNVAEELKYPYLPHIEYSIDYLNPSYLESFQNKMKKWNNLITNRVMTFEDLKNNYFFKNDIKDFKTFIETLLKELEIIDKNLKHNESYNTSNVRLFKSYLDYYNSNKDSITFLSSIANIDLKPLFKEQEYFVEKLPYLMKGQNLLDFEDYKNKLSVKDRSTKFMLACSQMLVNDNNSNVDYKIDDFINIFLKDKSINYYNITDINKYGILLKKEFNNVNKYKEAELKKISEYILYTELYNVVSSLVLVLRTSKYYNSPYYLNLSDEDFKDRVVMPLVLSNLSGTVDLAIIRKIIDRVLKDYSNYSKKSIINKFKEGVNKLLEDYNSSVNEINGFCKTAKETSTVHNNLFSCYKRIPKLTISNVEKEPTYLDYYEDTLNTKYSKDLESPANCDYILDLKYKEDKKLYQTVKENIDYIAAKELTSNPVFLLASSMQLKNKKIPADYSLLEKDLVFERCFKGDGTLFENLDIASLNLIQNSYYKIIIGELKMVLKELEVLYEVPYFSISTKAKHSVNDYYITIKERLKSSPSLIINIVENDIKDKEKQNINNVDIEKHLCSIIRDINREDELINKAENLNKALILAGFIVSRFNLPSNILVLANAIVIVSSIFLASSKIINFLELEKLELEMKQFLFTNHLEDHEYLIESLRNAKGYKNEEFKEAVVEIVFLALIGLQSVKQFRSAFKNYKATLKFNAKNPKINPKTRYVKPDLVSVSNRLPGRNYYRAKDWFKQVWNCKGNNFTDDLLKVALPTAVVGNALGVVPYIIRMSDDLQFDWTEAGIDIFTGTLISTVRNMVGLRGVNNSSKILDYGSRYILLAGWGLVKVGINNISYYKFENDRADVDRYVIARLFGETFYSGIISPLSSLSILKILKGVACLYPGGVSGKILKYGMVFSTSYLMGDIFHTVRFDSIDKIYSEETDYYLVSKEKIDKLVFILENYSTLKIEEKAKLLEDLDVPIWDNEIYDDSKENFLYISDLDLELKFFNK